MPYSSLLIAYAFVKRGIDTGQPITQMKLQKMIYFAQGIHLALYNEPLLKETFQAWKYGPVIPDIYHAYKLYGSNPIDDTSWIWNGEIANEELNTLSENAKKTINYTWDTLKDINAVKLSNWTHKEGSPWQKVYVNGANDVLIPNNEITSYFTRFLVK